MPEPFDRLRQYSRITAHLDRVHDEIIPSGANYGQISKTEAEFLMNRILDEHPRFVLEIGTAAGASTVHMLTALQLLGNDFRLAAVEYLEHCYFDPSRTPGFLVGEVFDTPPRGYALHLGKSSFDIGEVAGDQKIDFLFVDGNHTHPWATMDTILALPFLSDNATIVYHDINLHHRGGAAKRHDKGPHNLFYHLSAAQKTVVGEFPYPNIGSLRLVGNPSNALGHLLGLLFHFPWEAQAWPPIDDTSLNRLTRFLERHWGRNACLAFLHGMEQREKLARHAR